MLAAILSALGLGGLAAACFLVPGLGVRLISMVRAAVGIVADYPWQAACAALALFSGWSWHGWTTAADQRDVLRTWQSEVTTATREASHLPKLDESYVAQQIRNIGADLDAVVKAQNEARAKALAAKEIRERNDERKRKERNRALKGHLDENRRRADVYFAAHRLPNDQAISADEARRRVSRADLPTPAFGAAQSVGPDREAELVAITRADLQICTDNTTRLHDGQAWATEVGLIPTGSTPVEAQPGDPVSLLPDQ